MRCRNISSLHVLSMIWSSSSSSSSLYSTSYLALSSTRSPTSVARNSRRRKCGGIPASSVVCSVTMTNTHRNNSLHILKWMCAFQAVLLMSAWGYTYMIRQTSMHCTHIVSILAILPFLCFIVSFSMLMMLTCRTPFHFSFLKLKLTIVVNSRN